MESRGNSFRTSFNHKIWICFKTDVIPNNINLGPMAINTALNYIGLVTTALTRPSFWNLPFQHFSLHCMFISIQKLPNPPSIGRAKKILLLNATSNTDNYVSPRIHFLNPRNIFGGKTVGLATVLKIPPPRIHKHLALFVTTVNEKQSILPGRGEPLAGRQHGRT